MRNTITRSFVKNLCKCIVYKDNKTHEETVVIPYGFNTDFSAEKYIRKNNLVDGKLAAVIHIEKVSALYGMDESDFIKLGKRVDERTKETRNCITKTVNGLVGTLVYMDAKHNIQYMSVRVQKGVNLDKQARALAPNGCKGITIENIKEDACLYTMDEATFIKNARPMRDHQHYITE